MRTGYSPFDMCNEAVRIIGLHCSVPMTLETEKQVILLLNKAESYKEMSAYQLSIARKKFAEYYYSNNFTGSALEQYQFAIKANPKISVKRRLKELSAINRNDLVYSLDGNMVGEPDMSNLNYYDIQFSPEEKAEYAKKEAASAKFHGMSLEEYRKWQSDLHEELHREADEEDSIYDPEFEDMLTARLEKMGEPYISEFLRLRPTKGDGVLSAKRLTELLLDSMEKSYAYEKKKNAT